MEVKISFKFNVNSISASEGLNVPPGWLWANTTETALQNKASFTTIDGSTITLELFGLAGSAILQTGAGANLSIIQLS